MSQFSDTGSIDLQTGPGPSVQISTAAGVSYEINLAAVLGLQSQSVVIQRLLLFTPTPNPRVHFQHGLADDSVVKGAVEGETLCKKASLRQQSGVTASLCKRYTARFTLR